MWTQWWHYYKRSFQKWIHISLFVLGLMFQIYWMQSMGIYWINICKIHLVFVPLNNSRNVSIDPIFLTLFKRPTACWQSLPSVSPVPGLSMIVTQGRLVSPNQCPTSHDVSTVIDFDPWPTPNLKGLSFDSEQSASLSSSFSPSKLETRWGWEEVTLRLLLYLLPSVLLPTPVGPSNTNLGLGSGPSQSQEVSVSYKKTLCKFWFYFLLRRTQGKREDNQNLEYW